MATGIGDLGPRKRKNDPREALNFATYGPDGMAGPSAEELARRRSEAIFNASAPRTAASIADFNKAAAGAGESFDQGNVARGIGQTARATLAGAAAPVAAYRDGALTTLDSLKTSRRAISDFASDVYNTTTGTAATAAEQLSQGFSGQGPALSSASAAPSQTEIDAYAKSRGLTSKPPASAAKPASLASLASPAAASPATPSKPASLSSIPNAPAPYAPMADNRAGGLASVSPEQAAQLAKSAPTMPTPTIGTAPQDRPTVRGIASFVEQPAGSTSLSQSRPDAPVARLDRGTFSVIGGNEPTAAPRMPQFKELNSRTMSLGEYADAKAFNRNLATSLGLQNQAAQTAIQGRSADARARIDELGEQTRAAALPSQIAEREAQAESNRANASRLSSTAPLAQRRSQLELAVLNGDAAAAQSLKSLAEANVGSKDFDLSRRTAFQKAYQDDVKRLADAGQPARTEQMYANSLSDEDRSSYGKQKVDFPKPSASIVSDLQARYKKANDDKNSALKTELLRRWADTFGEDGAKYLSK